MKLMIQGTDIKNITSKIRAHPTASRPLRILNIFIEYRQPGGPHIIIGLVYRAPNTDIVSFKNDLLSILVLFMLLQKIETYSIVFIIAGDFNLNLHNSNSPSATSEFINNYMLSFNFIPMVSNQTRISDASTTLIYNIFI